jgi:glycosyltransferase involved in cell wall biosynthesis
MPGKVLFPADVLATAKTLDDAGLLNSLFTRAITTFSKRPASPVARGQTEAKWSADLVFYLMLALARSRTRATDASFAFLDRRASNHLDQSIGGVFGREDCCVQTFRAAKKVGVPTIYQLPTAYWRKVHELMQRELAEFPNICRVASDLYEFDELRTIRKDAELDLADHVLCPSTFVRESLSHHRSSDLEVIPFGVDQAQPSQAAPRKQLFLYAGNITMRKGVHRLLLAWKELKAYRTYELRLIGDMFLSEKFLNDFRGMFTHLPRLSRVDLDQHYAEASAFVFNPVADGFGNVILEAMRTGTPVIASKNSGAPDAITNRVEGLLVDYGDQRQLASALNFALSNPAEMHEMGKAAAGRASKYTWRDYGDRLLTWLRPLLKHG